MSDSNFRKLSATQIVYYKNHLLLKRPKWEADSTNDILLQAKVDPIPHQVKAAQFVFRNPFQGGVILGDEVGLGKTIETGLVLSQLWAEKKRKILIIAPKSLRHQWQDELRELFYLDSAIIDTQFYKRVIKGVEKDPLLRDEIILITNEHFVAKYDEKVLRTNWDLVVIDEAHKLRNVWRPGNTVAIRAKAIRDAIAPFKKLLLTATPMQNNLMELYGLCTFLDPYILGSMESFKRNFANISADEYEEKIPELRNRMGLFFNRELRKNVQSFIPYTNRNAVTIPFEPTEHEEDLRIKFENYLRDENTIALPPIANGFLRLVYFKLMASSSFALKNSLNNLYIRLIYASVELNERDLYECLLLKIENLLLLENGIESQDLVEFRKILFKKIKQKSFEGIKQYLDELKKQEDLLDAEEASENYDDADLESLEDDNSNPSNLSVSNIMSESELILNLIDLSRRLTKNSKGRALIEALKLQFKRAKENGWPEKAVIFTEFKTTQGYVISALEQFGMNLDDDIVVFNGGSGSAEDRRRLVDEFKGDKKIFLTTEAGAEGLNLQFCNLLINYDLPWNPQRIEQRIGRCHRYGQKLDVVVVNFANKKNIADQRILELLDSKFKLFEGAFGASNSVLGEIESGTDIEKEILNIYLTCRNEDEISKKFDELLIENKEQRDTKFAEAKEILLNQFDEEVRNKLKALDDEIKRTISKTEELIQNIVLSHLPEHRASDGHSFFPGANSIGMENQKSYTFFRDGAGEKITKNHFCLDQINSVVEGAKSITFYYSGNHSISQIASEVGSSGVFAIYKLRFDGIDSKESLFPIFIKSDGEIYDQEFGEKLLSVTAEETSEEEAFLEGQFLERLGDLIKADLSILEEYNEELYNEEMDKLDCYFEDLQELKKREIADIEKEMSKLKKERRKLKITDQKELNKQIQKIKNQIIKKEEEITEYRKENARKEKERLEELNNSSQIQTKSTLVAFGRYRIR